MSAKLRIWAQLPPMPREPLMAAVQRFEAAALEGIWCSQTFGAPFGPLSAAAVAIEVAEADGKLTEQPAVVLASRGPGAAMNSRSRPWTH